MDDRPLRDPWLLAAWPGMGSVALGAVLHMSEQLETEAIAELSPSGYFDVTQVQVKDGIIQPAGRPHNTLSVWRNPDPEGRDLLVFLGEAQPATKGYEFCQELMEHALAWGVTRVFTFAAMATPTHPRADARVFGVATRHGLAEELQPYGVVLLGEGEISGLNGVLLAAAAERGVGGVCLLGEFPYFASGIRNPKASAAVLRVFAQLADLGLSYGSLDEEAKSVEKGLTQVLEKLKQAGPAQLIIQSEGQEAEEEPEFPAVDPDEADEEERPRLTAAQRIRLDQLFQAAQKDRQEAMRLKAELDRLGVFKEYEDRFLDLFKRGE